MTTRELRAKLFEVENQDEEISKEYRKNDPTMKNIVDKCTQNVVMY